MSYCNALYAASRHNRHDSCGCGKSEKSPVYQFTVAGIDTPKGEGSGKLSVNTNANSFTFSGRHDAVTEPATTYYLYVTSPGGDTYLGSGMPDSAGNVIISDSPLPALPEDVMWKDVTGAVISTTGPLTAAFSWVQTVTSMPCAYFDSFASTPYGSIVAWSWDFDDGQTSSDAYPFHVYEAPGTYTVKLTVTDNGGAQDSISHDVTVTVDSQAPDAYFTYWQPKVFEPIMYFSDSSTQPYGEILEWSWDFDDGQMSTAQNPTHEYASAGTYTVTLTVKGSFGLTDEFSAEVEVVVFILE